MASEHRRAVGIFPDRPRTASALQALSDSGFSMNNVSVIAKDPGRQNAIAGVNVKDEVTNRAEQGGTVGGVTGGILGGVTGLLVGLGTLTIPGFGPALLAGEAATVLSTLIGAGAGVAAGGLVGALIGMGIPEHRAKHYQDRVTNGDYLVMLRDTEPEIARAEKTLKDAGIEDWGIYPVTGNKTQSSESQFDEPERRVDAGRLAASGVAQDVDKRRGNADNRVDHPADQQYPHLPNDTNDGLLPPTGLPHASNPVEAVPSSASHPVDNTDERRAVGIFRDRREMEGALDRLRKAGFPMHQLSILVREADAVTPTNQTIGKSNSLAGATATGWASEADPVELPGIGTTLIMGPDAQAISQVANRHSSYSTVSVLENLGIAHESANLYSRHLIDGDYLVTMRGRNQDLMSAASTLGEYGMRDWGIYDLRPA